MRIFAFLVGLAMFLAGVASYFELLPLPIELKTTTVGISMTGLSLDVVLIVVGVLVMMITWVFGRLSQFE